jgi:cell division protease FtsH
MDKWRQQFSIGYFVVALLILFALQTYFAAPQIETVGYSQFKTLVKKGLVANLIVGEKLIQGEIKPEGVKEALSPERLKALGDSIKDNKKAVPFVTVRVEDSELISDLENEGIAFKGEVVNEWLSTLLSWVVPVVLFFVLWNFLLKRFSPGGGMMQIGKSKAKVYIEKKTGVPFKTSQASTKRKKNWSKSSSFLRLPKNISA